MVCIRGRKNNEPHCAASLVTRQTYREMQRTIGTAGNLRLGLLIHAGLPRMACSPRLPQRRRRDFGPRHPFRASSNSFFCGAGPVVRQPCVAIGTIGSRRRGFRSRFAGSLNHFPAPRMADVCCRQECSRLWIDREHRHKRVGGDRR